jgi:hypothetical protein
MLLLSVIRQRFGDSPVAPAAAQYLACLDDDALAAITSATDPAELPVPESCTFALRQQE